MQNNPSACIYINLYLYKGRFYVRSRKIFPYNSHPLMKYQGEV